MRASHQHYHPSSHRIGIISSLYLSLLVLSSAVSALPPAPVSSMAYITIDENTLYVQGGIDPSDTNKTSSAVKSKQFFSLDLTRPNTWNTTTATTLPWTQLNADGDSGPAAYGHFLSVTPKRRNIVVWDPSGANSSIMSYSLDANRWTKVGDRPKELTTQPGLQAVADPTSGLVYIPSGRNNADGDMLIYDLLTSMTKWAPMPPREPSNVVQWYGYSFVWSSYRSSFLIFGGGGGDVGSYFYEFKVSDNNWTDLALQDVQGFMPPRVKNACLAPAYNGTKMILFGGQTSNDSTPGNLYTLDMESMTWNLTQTVPSSQSRHSMACSVSGDNFIIWGGQSSVGAIMSGTPLIYNINTTKWTTQFVRGTSFTPTGPLTARNTDPTRGGGSGYETTKSSSADVGGAIAASVVVVAFVGFLFYRRRKRQRALKNGGLFSQMPESDVSLTHIVSPPPLPGAGTSGQGNFTELNSSRQRLHGSHSNSQPITLAGHQVSGNNNDPNNNYNHNNNTSYNALNTDSSYNTHAHSIDNNLDSRPLPLPPISAVPPTNPSWSTPPQNPSWPTSAQPSCPSLHHQPSSSSPSSSSSWAIPPSNSPSAPPPPNSPSVPPPPYRASVVSSPAVVFRKEAMTEPTPVPVGPIEKEAMTGSIPVHTFNSNNHNTHINNSGSSSGNSGGYAIHERQVKELQHQLAARKEELVRRNSGQRPQYYPPPPPVVSGGSSGFTASKAVARSPQGAGNPVVKGSSNSGSSTTGGTSNEELQQQVQALQAELNRLQALIGS